MKKDPVCSMEVDEHSCTHRFEYKGQTFYFCSEHCLNLFKQEPEKHLQQLPVERIQRKVAIVGTGNVGTTFAYALMMKGLAHSIVLIGRSPQKVQAHVMDLNHGMMFVPPSRIYAGDYSDCQDADLVVVTAGVAQNPGGTRLDLAQNNADLFKDIIPRICRYNPKTLLIVTNPVDVLTYVALKISGYPMNRILGSGTSLDTARFRYLLSAHCEVAAYNVHAYILGEHGDSEVPVWSKVMIGGIPLRTYCPICERQCRQEELDKIFLRVKNAAYEIIEGKGATYFGIGLALVRIVESILRDENNIMTVSTLVDGSYGIGDVCLSLPVLMNRNGVAKFLDMDLEEKELRQLRYSAQYLKETIQDLGF